MTAAPVLAALPGWPSAASTAAASTDRLTLVLVGISVLLVVLLGGLNLYCIVRYRRGSKAPRPPLKISESKVEIFWIAATTLGFLGLFYPGARAYLAIETPPPGTTDIHVIGRQWMWDIRQPNGRREFDTLHVPVGVPIRLVLTSEDVIHSFFVPAFRLKQDVIPGKAVSLWFTATKPGAYPLYCTEFCGAMHERMTGTVLAQSPGDYARWLAAGGAAADETRDGRRLFVQYGCAGCHTPGGAVRAPALEGLYGTRVPLARGGFATVDEVFLRDCILEPRKNPPAGYEAVMPSFRGVIPEGDLLSLIAYLRDSARPASPP